MEAEETAQVDALELVSTIGFEGIHARYGISAQRSGSPDGASSFARLSGRPAEGFGGLHLCSRVHRVYPLLWGSAVCSRLIDGAARSHTTYDYSMNCISS